MKKDGCEVDFYVEFEFNTSLLNSVLDVFFSDAVKKMVFAFEQRADILYG